MQVSELLSRKGAFVAVVDPTAPIKQALQLLTTHDIGALVVTRDGTQIRGIFSERDVVRALDRIGSPVLEEPVQSIMSSTVRTCSPDDSVESLMAIMTTYRVRHLPVIDKGVLAGIVSIGDVVKTRMEELEKDRDSLVNYIYAR